MAVPVFKKRDNISLIGGKRGPCLSIISGLMISFKSSSLVLIARYPPTIEPAGFERVRILGEKKRQQILVYGCAEGMA